MQAKKKVLISVTDKTGLVDFAKGLVDLGFEILSTGGTAKLLRDSGLAALEVSEYTKSPEILDGRVKTLHPLVHGGILYDRHSKAHEEEAKAHGIEGIDMVVVNLYDFQKKSKELNLSLEEAIHHIDIGGPTMLRAAAKNWQHVLSVIDPKDYPLLLEELQKGEVSKETRIALARKTFGTIARYDAMIAGYFGEEQDSLHYQLVQPLRYGENPHQKARFVTFAEAADGLQNSKVLQGKELSYNNLLDLDSATGMVCDLRAPAVAIIKHTNPCGCASGDEPVPVLFQKALACDPKSAFGGIIAINREVDEIAAQSMIELFVECIAAPAYTEAALHLFQKKKNLRILQAPFLHSEPSEKSLEIRSIRGGLLIQDKDRKCPDAKEFTVKTKSSPDARTIEDLVFAQTIAKHVKSNAIVFAKDGTTLAIGAGQMSRIDAAQFAIAKAKEHQLDLKDSVMASDAFFPFRDTVDLAISSGVKAIIQPGGSMRDDESIKACDEAHIPMVFTGTRHFKH